MARTTITVDERLWRRFRAIMVLQGRDASEVVMEMVEDYIKRNEAEARRAAEAEEN